jgi:hypothetical protein
MRTTLKATVLFALAVTFFSCRKSSESNTTFYFQGNFDGSEKSFNTSVIASKSSLDSAIYYLSVAGASDTEASAIVLWSDQDNFTAGSTYTVTALNGSKNNELSYYSLLGSSAPSTIWNTTYNYGHINQQFTCTITEITSAYIKGTFSGVLYMNTDSAVVSKTVDSGRFYAKFL